MNLGFSGPTAERAGVVEKVRRGIEMFGFRYRVKELKELLDSEGGMLGLVVLLAIAVVILSQYFASWWSCQDEKLARQGYKANRTSHAELYPPSTTSPRTRLFKR